MVPNIQQIWSPLLLQNQKIAECLWCNTHRTHRRTLSGSEWKRGGEGIERNLTAKRTKIPWAECDVMQKQKDFLCSVFRCPASVCLLIKNSGAERGRRCSNIRTRVWRGKSHEGQLACIWEQAEDLWRFLRIFFCVCLFALSHHAREFDPVLSFPWHAFRAVSVQKRGSWVGVGDRKREKY